MYDNDAYPATITFPAESHLYDVINGKYLGSKKEITGEISYRAQLYAMLPYRVRELQIRGSDKCVAGVGASFTVEVIPDGQCRRVQTCVSRGGRRPGWPEPSALCGECACREWFGEGNDPLGAQRPAGELHHYGAGCD